MNGRKPPTIYDVSKQAGVSTATVSRVLNAPASVKAETRKKVLDVIDRIGFVPSAEASARARRELGRIGVLTPFFSAPAFVQRIRGISKTVAGRGYELVIYPVETMAQLEEYFSILPVSRRLDGLIIISLHLDESTADRLRSNHLPTVLIDSTHPDFSSVDINNVEGGQIAAEYLVRKGYTDFAFLGEVRGPAFSLHPTRDRLYGFKKGLEEAGFELPDNSELYSQYSVVDAREKARDMLNTPPRPRAIFAATDLQAVGVLKAVKDMGLSVPDDVAVMGFDDIDVSEYLELTTVSQKLDESGRIAVDLLLSEIKDETSPVQHTHSRIELRKRSSA